MTDLITLIANVALALSFITALIFGVAQVNASKRDRRERLTLETLRNFQTREFAEFIHYNVFHKVPVSQQDFITRQKDEQVFLIQFGQQMESLGFMVAENFIDVDLIDKTLGSFVITSWEKYKAWYLDIRENQPDPFLAEYFQWLAEHIEQRMTDQPRLPFYLSPKPNAHHH